MKKGVPTFVNAGDQNLLELETWHLKRQRRTFCAGSNQGSSFSILASDEK